jgi:transcriptional regulator with XRE-family HTH domain
MSKPLVLSIESRNELIKNRLNKNMSQEHLGLVIAIKKSIIRDIENGKILPTDREFQVLEKFFNIKLKLNINSKFELTEEDIKSDWRLIEFMKNPSDSICELAVNLNWQALEFIENKTPKLCHSAVKKNWRAIKFIENQTIELCDLAFKQDWRCIRYLKIQRPDICKIAVTNNGLSIQYIIDQTEDLCILAVEQNWRSLDLVKRQTEEICLKAIENNYLAITKVKKQTHKLCLKAIEQNINAIKVITLRPLKLVKISGPLTDDNCGVCLDNSSDSNWCQLLMCKHKFHVKCFNMCDTNLIKKCPLCRTEYLIPVKEEEPIAYIF